MEEDSSTFSRLPDEMVLHILCKVIDLKTLCLCKLVSKCFHRIVLQVDTISFTSPFNSFNYPFVDPPNLDWNDSSPVASLGSFGSAIWSLKRFERVKSLSIHLSATHDNCSLFKWKIKFGNTLDSLLFLSPTLIFKNRILYVRHVNEEDDEDEEEDLEKLENKVYIMEKCLKDAIMRIRLVYYFINFPLLENVSITDSGKRGKVSLSGGKIGELRKRALSLHSNDTIIHKLNHLDFPATMSWCCLRMMDLLVSGYVMKGISLVLLHRHEELPDADDDFWKNDDMDEEKEEAVYSEAVMSFLKNYRNRFVTSPINYSF